MSKRNTAPEGADFDNLSLAGFAATAVEKLRAQAQGQGTQREQAADALALLVRLVGRAASESTRYHR